MLHYPEPARGINADGQEETCSLFIFVSEQDAIKIQRANYEGRERLSNLSDEELLDEFIITNWAETVRVDDFSQITNKWDRRFYKIALEVGEWSKDPTTKVGAVIVKDRKIIATGYNGLPAAILDDDRALNREWKIKVTIHAEANAIFNAAKNGSSVRDATIFVTMFPCSNCAASIIQSGIKRVVAPGKVPERWLSSKKLSLELFKEAEVEVYEF